MAGFGALGAKVLPDREQLGAHDAGSGSLARRQSHLDERIIVIVGLGVGKAHGASFHHPPAAFDYHLGRIGSEPIPLRHALEEQVDHSDHGYGIGISHQPADRRIDGHARVLPMWCT